MATVNVNITTVEKPNPGVPGFATYQYFLQPVAGGAQGNNGTSPNTSFSFLGVPNGQYYVEVFPLDTNGNRMDAGKRSADFTVPPVTSSVYQSPDVVTVNVT